MRICNFKNLVCGFLVFISYETYSQISFKFDSTSKVDGCGCGDVILQKVTEDKQYELLVSIEIDSVPRNCDLDLSIYLKYFKITLNKYSKKNDNILVICSDLISSNRTINPPIVYSAHNGFVNIRNYSNHMLTIEFNNLTFINKKKNVIKLPNELFNNLYIGCLP